MLMSPDGRLDSRLMELDSLPSITVGSSFVESAAIAAMQTLIVVNKGILDPDTCASLAFDFAEALNKVRDSKQDTEQ